jgi:putative flippase GtrA
LRLRLRERGRAQRKTDRAGNCHADCYALRRAVATAQVFAAFIEALFVSTRCADDTEFRRAVERSTDFLPATPGRSYDPIPRSRVSMHFFRQCAHFHGVGTVGAAVNLATLYVAHELLGIWVYAAMVIAFTTANFTSFVAVKQWTFKDSSWSRGSVIKQWSRFYSIAVTGLGLNVIVFGLLHDHAGMGVYGSQCLALIAVAPVHFVLNKVFTFPETVEPDAEPDPAS